MRRPAMLQKDIGFPRLASMLRDRCARPMRKTNVDPCMNFCIQSSKTKKAQWEYCDRALRIQILNRGSTKCSCHEMHSACRQLNKSKMSKCRVSCVGRVDAGERVRGFRQLFGQAGTPSSTPQEGGLLQGSHLPSCTSRTGTFLKL